MNISQTRKVELKRYYLPGYLYFVTSVTEQRRKVFHDEANIQHLLTSFQIYRRKYKFKIVAYCILPDHFHGIVIPSEEANISKIMQAIKAYSGKQLNLVNGWGGRLWQHQFLDHLIRRGEDYQSQIDYIHKNPIKHKLVEEIGSYKWSSYRNYYLADDSILVVDKIHL